MSRARFFSARAAESTADFSAGSTGSARAGRAASKAATSNVRRCMGAPKLRRRLRRGGIGGQTETSTESAMPLARDILIDILRDEGVTHIFGNPGSTEMPLMDALVDAADLTYVLGLQEATAVGMADG